MTLTIGPWAQKPKQPVWTTLTSASRPAARISSRRFAISVWEAEAWQPVPPQQRMSFFFESISPCATRRRASLPFAASNAASRSALLVILFMEALSLSPCIR